MELFRLAKDIFKRKYNPIEFPVTLLGGTVAHNEQELNSFLLCTTLFTYRSGFRQFARSDCTSDKGWGCLIRTCQMMVARCLALHGQLDLSWFRDLNDDRCPFSIHKFIRFVQNPNEAFDAKFWTPAQGCEAIRNTLIELGSMHMLNKPLTAYVCPNSTIVLEDVQFRLDDGMSVLLLLPTVTGLQRTITQGTYLCLEQLLQVPHCCGIVAGVPNRSYFVIGVTGQRFCFLDPHTTQPAFVDNGTLANYYETCSTLPAVSWSRIDSSILIGFYIASHSEWDSFVDNLAEVKRRSGGVELFSVATKAMLKGGIGAKKPAAQHLYMRRSIQEAAAAAASSAVSPTTPPPSTAAATTTTAAPIGRGHGGNLPPKRGGPLSSNTNSARAADAGAGCSPPASPAASDAATTPPPSVGGQEAAGLRSNVSSVQIEVDELDMGLGSRTSSSTHDAAAGASADGNMTFACGGGASDNIGALDENHEGNVGLGSKFGGGGNSTPERETSPPNEVTSPSPHGLSTENEEKEERKGNGCVALHEGEFGRSHPTRSTGGYSSWDDAEI